MNSAKYNILYHLAISQRDEQKANSVVKKTKYFRSLFYSGNKLEIDLYKFYLNFKVQDSINVKSKSKRKMTHFGKEAIDVQMR